MDVYQYVPRKAFESALSIDYSIRTEPRAHHFVVFFEVILTNIGNRRITVTRPSGVTRSCRQLEIFISGSSRSVP